MAYQEQLAIIRQGVAAWNAWRNQHPDVKVELSFANISGDLSGIDLSRANLSRATFPGTKLRGANLRGANLRAADLRGADLSGADLSEADLVATDLTRANLTGANFSHAKIEYTMFVSVDLRQVKGLETVQHRGPSPIGTDTLLRSEGDIPACFLRGTGLSDSFIDYIRSLSQRPIEYYSILK